MDIFKILEIFAAVTGVVYLIMQIFQSRYMWYFYIPSVAALAACMFHQSAWAFFALNVYFVIMGFIGLKRWNADKGEKKQGEKDQIVMNRMKKQEYLIAALILAVCIPLLGFVLGKSGDQYPWLDAIGTSLSIVATWWLTKSHIQQWIIWIIADLFVISMQIQLGNKYLTIMYCLYIVSSIIGFTLWSKKGVYKEEAA